MDSGTKDKLVVSVLPAEEQLECDNSQDTSELENQFGRAVYTIDSLVSSGVFAGSQENALSGNDCELRTIETEKSYSLTAIDETINNQLAQSPMHPNRYDRRSVVPSLNARGAPVSQQVSQHVATYTQNNDLIPLLESLPDCVSKRVL